MAAGPVGSTGYCGGKCCIGDCEYDSGSRAFFCCTPGTTLENACIHLFYTRHASPHVTHSLHAASKQRSSTMAWTRPVWVQVLQGPPVIAVTSAARPPLMCASSTGTTAPTPPAVRLLTCMLFDGAMSSIQPALILHVVSCLTAVSGQSGAVRVRTICVRCTTSTCTFSDACSADSTRSAALLRLHSFMSLSAHSATLHDSC